MIKGNLRGAMQPHRSPRVDPAFLIFRLRAVRYTPASLAFEKPDEMFDEDHSCFDQEFERKKILFCMCMHNRNIKHVESTTFSVPTVLLKRLWI